jgi:predicted 3-demethylubiquinone-9 3-methyltransferase (glyoxalase superfamily)
MKNHKISPCIWFQNHVEEAVKLYISTFKNSKITHTTYYTDAGEKVSGIPKGTVQTISFEAAGLEMLGLNGGPSFGEQSPSVSLFVTCGSVAELDTVYNKLSAGGSTLLPLQEYPFSKRYVFFSDKYGIHWQLFLEEGSAQKITPSIIFGGDHKGLGAKAMEFYLKVFKNSKTLVDFRYAQGEGDGIPGSVKHARLLLDGSEMVIMDSGHSQPMKMSNGISFIIHCKNQAEVDYFWDAIAKKGQEIQCGWISDEFGVTWQVVPDELNKLMEGEPKRSERMMQAMFKMKKLNIDELKQIYSSN